MIQCLKVTTSAPLTLWDEQYNFFGVIRFKGYSASQSARAFVTISQVRRQMPPRLASSGVNWPLAAGKHKHKGVKT